MKKHTHRPRYTIAVPHYLKIVLELTDAEAGLERDFPMLKPPSRHIAVFRVLRARRDISRHRIEQQQRIVSDLERKLSEAKLALACSRGALRQTQECLSVLAMDKETDFLWPVKNTEGKIAARQQNRKYYAAVDCWLCGGEMPLEEFKDKQRRTCGAKCRKLAERLRKRFKIKAPVTRN